MRTPILALLACLLALAGLPGCSPGSGGLEESTYEHADRAEELIREGIVDEERAARVAGLQALVGEEMRKFYRNFAWAQEDIQFLNADYDVSRDTFERIADSLDQDRARTTDTLIRVAMRMRSETTPEEWKQLKEGVR